METINSRDMQILDLNCEFFGLSRLQLMENAGKAVADEISKRFRSCRVTVVAGLGNNGGDAFVTARHLRNFDVEVFVVGKRSEVRTREARINLSILEKAGLEVKEGIPEDFGDVVVDGLLGTGIRGEPKEPIATAIDSINKSKAFVVAIDVPSGLNSDTGEYKKAVISNLTVTFHKMKPGLLKAPEICGEIVVANIGIPEGIEKQCGVGDVAFTYKRFPEGHKGDHGRILVVGGGEYTGAPALASLAAYAAGADIVTTLVPETIKNVIASFSPNLIVKGLEGEKIGLKHVEKIKKLVKLHDVVVMGMGVGENEEFEAVVLEVIKSCRKVVLDAQGLVKEVPEGVECIMTPHRGEFRRVFGDSDVKMAAKKARSVILLKGKEDFVTDGERLKVNRSGNAGMTVGGTGDVLAGVCAAFFCNDDAFHAACAAAFLNGFAGDLCFEKYGYNYTATQLIEEIPIAVKKCLEFGKG